MKLIITEHCKKTFEGTTAELEELLEELEKLNPEDWEVLDSFEISNKKELNFND